MTIADDYFLRLETASMNDVADFVDLFDTSTSFTPTLSASGSMTASSATGGSCRYWTLGNLIIAKYYITDITLGGSASNEIRATLPITADGSGYGGGAAVGNTTTNGGLYLFVSTTVVGFRKSDASNYTASGSTNDIIQTVIYER